MKQQISGTVYSYYFLCKRKMWLFYYGITEEQNSDLVSIGKTLDENSYIREKHNLNIDSISIDHLSRNVIYEVKKSSKNSEMAKAQVKYYLYVLKNKGIENVSGCIQYPLEKRRENVFLEYEDIVYIDECMEDIEKILNRDMPQTPTKISACKSCAYYEFCYI